MVPKRHLHPSSSPFPLSLNVVNECCMKSLRTAICWKWTYRSVLRTTTTTTTEGENYSHSTINEFNIFLIHIIVNCYRTGICIVHYTDVAARACLHITSARWRPDGEGIPSRVGGEERPGEPICWVIA